MRLSDARATRTIVAAILCRRNFNRPQPPRDTGTGSISHVDECLGLMPSMDRTWPTTVTPLE